MNLIFLGPPGAGKGTLAVKAAEKLSIPHISTGDLFRRAIAEKTPLGLKVKAIIEQGGLVPDDLTIALVQDRLSGTDCKNGFILDGFPRTIPQAEAMGNIITINKVIDFAVPDEEVIKRLSGRRTCSSCGASFHIIFVPPRKEGVCDNCNSPLMTRPDDSIDSIKNRLAVYKNQTEPLIEFYTRKGTLTTIDGTPAPTNVFEKLISIIN